METYPEVSEVYSAYHAVLSEYNRKVESMLSAARDPHCCAEELRALTAEVSHMAARLSQLRTLISSHYQRLTSSLST